MKMKKLKIKSSSSFLLTFVLCCSCKFIHGPAKLTLLKVEDCPDVPNLTWKSTFRIHMFNRTTQVVDANFSLPYDIDNSIEFSLKSSRLDKKQSAITIHSHDACQVLSNCVGDLWLNWESQLGIPPSCPIKKGTYSIKNYYIDMDLLKVKTIFEGFFYSRVIMKKDGVTFFCMDYELKLEQKI